MSDRVCKRTDCKACTEDCIWRPTTNADRIRTMTDEELAKTLYMGCGDRNWDTCKISEKYDEDNIFVMSDEEEDALCIQCWIEWLRQEIDNVQKKH